MISDSSKWMKMSRWMNWWKKAEKNIKINVRRRAKIHLMNIDLFIWPSFRSKCALERKMMRNIFILWKFSSISYHMHAMPFTFSHPVMRVYDKCTLILLISSRSNPHSHLFICSCPSVAKWLQFSCLHTVTFILSLTRKIFCCNKIVIYVQERRNKFHLLLLLLLLLIATSSHGWMYLVIFIFHINRRMTWKPECYFNYR